MPRAILKNFAGTIDSYLRTDATASRVYQFPNKDITIAGLDDVDAAFGVNVTRFASIQAAVDSVTTGNDLNLYFPPGTYNITTAITIANKGRVNINSFGAIFTNSLTANGDMFDIDDCLSLSVFNINIDMNANTFTTVGINAKNITGTAKFTNIDVYDYGKDDAVGIKLENAPRGATVFNYGTPGANFNMCNFYNEVTVTLPASYDYNSNTNKGHGIWLYDQAEYAKITNCSFVGIQIGCRLRSGANVVISACEFVANLPKLGGVYGTSGCITLEAGGTNGGKVQIVGCNFNHNWMYCILSSFNTTERPVFVNNCNFIANGFTCIYASASSHDRWMITNNWFDRANMHIGAINDPVSGSTERYIYTVSSRNTVRLNTFLSGINGACVGSGSPANFNIVKNNNYETGLTVATLNGANNVVADNDVI